MSTSELDTTLNEVGYLLPALDSRAIAAMVSLRLEEAREQIDANDVSGALRSLAQARRTLQWPSSAGIVNRTESVAATLTRVLLRAESLLAREDGSGAMD